MKVLYYKSLYDTWVAKCDEKCWILWKGEWLKSQPWCHLGKLVMLPTELPQLAKDKM